MKTPISRFTVHGNSMTPTLHPGQDVLSVNWFVKPKVGDVVIVNRQQPPEASLAKGGGAGNREIIKRIQRIDGDQVWVVGDNEDESTDSRDFGPVNIDQIVGKII